ncbi:MAG: Rrf2 family transcriptional regulator [Alphaproteobacteria bacterium]|nr:Rrf2 family transcriptional regulator [Alphaproteobacteria bacterium]
MLRLSRKLMFSIEAMVDIAYNAADTPVQSKDIATRQNIPRRYLEQVLQQLVREGVLSGVRGPRGGYRFARERRRVTLGQITRIVAAMEDTSDPVESSTGSMLGREVLRPIWHELQNDALAKLDQISIEDLCGRARNSGIEGACKQIEVDFAI